MALALRRSTLTHRALLVLALGISACSSEGGGDTTTTGKRVVLHTKLAPTGLNVPVVTATGWTVSVTGAVLATGALYYYDGAPILSWSPLRTRGVPRVLAFMAPLFGMPVSNAHAHPGHYVPGQAMGEMRESSSVDLLGGDATYPDGNGITGTYRSATFTFGSPPAVGPAAAPLGSHAVVLVGEATKGVTTHRFRAQLDTADVLDAESRPIVEGCIFREVPVTGDGTVHVIVRPSVWLDQVDFTNLPAPIGADPVDVPRDSEAFRALARGVRKATAYEFAFVP